MYKGGPTKIGIEIEEAVDEDRLSEVIDDLDDSKAELFGNKR